MEKHYTEADLVLFGKYLLSPQRTKSVQRHPVRELRKELVKMVHDADIANWKELSGQSGGVPKNT